MVKIYIRVRVRGMDVQNRACGSKSVTLYSKHEYITGLRIYLIRNDDLFNANNPKQN